MRYSRKFKLPAKLQAYRIVVFNEMTIGYKCYYAYKFHVFMLSIEIFKKAKIKELSFFYSHVSLITANFLKKKCIKKVTYLWTVNF